MTPTFFAAALALTSVAPAQDRILVDFTTPDIVGPLDEKVVTEGLARRVAGVTRCYEPALADAPKLFGLARIDLKVDIHGQVTSSVLRDHGLADQSVADCIVGVLKVVPLSQTAGADEVEIAATVRLAPTQPQVPRGKLAKAIKACGGTPEGDSDAQAMARIDVEGGRVQLVSLGLLAPVGDDVKACLDQALINGPHKVGDASRYYQWTLGD